MTELHPCICGRPFVPELDYYFAHLQTPEHQRWRHERETGKDWEPAELTAELFGLRTSRRKSVLEVAD
jgi:hypothetical protein